MRHIALITTGGTIEKTYDEATGSLGNTRSIVDRMLRRLRLADTAINVIELMSKDSLHMTDTDRGTIAETVEAVLRTQPTGVVILHGTDTLELTGKALHDRFANTSAPIILTGAMRPYEMVRSDALQNLTEAVFAAGVLKPSVYCVAHGRALAFPNVGKDRAKGTFVETV
ncbi:MAG: asparaginase domain-containing protein [Phycisphaerales bacterium]|jgi:L-asparaginase